MDPAIREEIRDQVIKQEVKQMIRSAAEQQPPLWRTAELTNSPANNSPSANRQQQRKPEEVRKLVDLRPAPPPTFLSASAARKSTDENGLRSNNNNNLSNTNGDNNSGVSLSSSRASSGPEQNGTNSSLAASKSAGGHMQPSGSNSSSSSFPVAKQRPTSSQNNRGSTSANPNESSQPPQNRQQTAEGTIDSGNNISGSSGRVNVGHIDESVNVKERASRFGSSLANNNKTAETPSAVFPPLTAAVTPTPKMRTLSVGSSGVPVGSSLSERKSAALDSDRLLRKFSAPSSGGGATSATSPNKIKNMTAIFEQKH